MALYTREEFAKLAGLKNLKNINVYIKRGKVILTGTMIDDQVLENKAWLEKQQVKRGIKNAVFEAEPAPVQQVAPNPVLNTAPSGPSETFQIGSSRPSKGVSLIQLETEIKKADLEKKQQDIKLLKIKESKLKGELIPTEMVYLLITEMSEAMKIAYNDAIENYTVIVSRQKKLTAEEEANIKSHFTRIINETLKRQTTIAKKGLHNIVSEYQEVRERGERK